MAGKRRRQVEALQRSKLTGHEARELIQTIIWAMAAADVLLGVGYVAGAPANTPSLMAMQTVAPLYVWFGCLVIAGAMLLTPRLDSVGFALGGLVYLVWLVFSVVAATWSWPLLMLVSFLHFEGAWVSGRLVKRTPRG